MTHYKLNNSSLNQLQGFLCLRIIIENVKTGIVHVGVGGFHRAHEAMYRSITT
jgi:mannitol 2-dehydrogenase